MKKTISAKISALVLAVVMLLSVLPVTAFAADGLTFGYYFADEAKTMVIIDDFTSDVPADGKVAIPAEYDGFKVVGVASYAFFELKDLTAVEIPSSVVLIEAEAFSGCENIADVTINSTDCDIAADVFKKTAWYENHEQDFIMNGTTLLYYKGSDETVYLPYNVTKIGNGAFKDNTSVKEVVFTDSVSEIGDYAFYGCENLESFKINSKIESVGSFAFDGTKWLKNYPSEFVIMGSTLIRYKGTDSEVVIPSNVTKIGDYAFEVKAKDIASRVFVPASVEEFGNECFFLYKSADNVYPDLFIYKGSKAQDYLDANGIGYETVGIYGDADLDGKVTAADARYVLRVSAKLEAPLTGAAFVCSDINNDSKISADDARLILRIAAKLDSAESVNAMPRSTYDTLSYVAKVLDQSKNKAGYSVLSYQSIKEYKMAANPQTYFNEFKKELVSEKKAAAVKYEAGTDDAIKNLYEVTLLDSSAVKSSSCVLKDGKYVITIVLNKETVSSKTPDSGSKTAKLMPVIDCNYYLNKLAGKYWYKAAGTSFDFDMTYTDCTMTMEVNAKTNRIENITYNMNYDIKVSAGKIMSIPIKDSKGKGGCSAVRCDTVVYSNFEYK